MIPDFLTVMAVIAVLSVVQSIFGMGVLIFGTPTLLLLGYDFVGAIAILVPASFAISLLQVATAGKHRVAVSPNLYLLCLPGIGGGLFPVRQPPLPAHQKPGVSPRPDAVYFRLRHCRPADELKAAAEVLFLGWR
jgi:hypothetical protein